MVFTIAEYHVIIICAQYIYSLNSENRYERSQMREALTLTGENDKNIKTIIKLTRSVFYLTLPIIKDIIIVTNT